MSEPNLDIPSTDDHWHYVQAGESRGPVTRNALVQLFQGNVLPPDTLVWHPTLTGWQPANQTPPFEAIAPGRSAAPIPETKLPRYAVVDEQFAQARFYYIDQGREKGPVPYQTLYHNLVKGKLPPTTLIRQANQGELRPARAVFTMESQESAHPPKLPVFWAEKTKDVPELAKTPILLTIFLTIITFGLYFPCWFLWQRKALNSLQGRTKLNKTLLIVGLVVEIINLIAAIVSGVFAGLAVEFPGYAFQQWSDRIGSHTDWIDIVTFIFYTAMVFMVRRILKEHYNEHLGQQIPFSGPATFFFQIYYLQYKINRLT